jgi:putative DNA primase/helicase
MALARLDDSSRGQILSRISKRTKTSIVELRTAFWKIAGESSNFDIGMYGYKKVLEKYFSNGDHLLRACEQFWAWAGTHWMRRHNEHMANLVSNVLIECPPQKGNVAPGIDQVIKVMTAHQTRQTAVFKLAQPPEPIIAVQNGELHIDSATGDVTFKGEHSPESYQTCCLSIAYDPEAQCPQYDKAILEMFSGDAERVRHLNEFIGYAIQPVRDIASIWLWYGGGKNGKTQLYETLMKLMSDDASAVIKIESLGGDFGLSQLVGRRLVVDDDVTANTVLPDGILKQISECKKATIDRKYKDHQDIVCYSLPLMLANNWPITKDVSWGFQRRIQVVPFLENFDGREDKTLFKRIQARELPGVLNRALEGYKRLRQRGDFDPPQACLDAKDEWLAAANNVAGFLKDEYKPQPKARLLRSKSYEHYSAWCQESKQMPVAHHKFISMMKQLGVRSGEYCGRDCWCDVELVHAHRVTIYSLS